MFLRAPEVAKLLNIGRRTLDTMKSKGEFPPADYAKGRKIRLWRRDTVDAWIAANCGGSKR
jgi:excisionase family DNA binding protein